MSVEKRISKNCFFVIFLFQLTTISTNLPEAWRLYYKENLNNYYGFRNLMNLRHLFWNPWVKLKIANRVTNKMKLCFMIEFLLNNFSNEPTLYICNWSFMTEKYFSLFFFSRNTLLATKFVFNHLLMAKTDLMKYSLMAKVINAYIFLNTCAVKLLKLLWKQ